MANVLEKRYNRQSIMITSALARYAEQSAEEAGTDAGEVLLLIILGWDVPDSLRGDAEKLRAMFRDNDDG